MIDINNKDKLTLINQASNILKNYSISQSDRFCSKKCNMETAEIEDYLININRDKSHKPKNSNILLENMIKSSLSNQSIYSTEISSCYKNCIKKFSEGYFLQKEIFRSKEYELLNIKDNFFIRFNQ